MEVIQINQELLNELINYSLHSPSLMANDNLKNDDNNFVVEGKKALTNEHLIAVRADIGCNHVPEHSHDYVEIIFMCQGSKVNIVNGESVLLSQGEILLLSQNCRHENLPSGSEDVSVNFIVLPHFFEHALKMLGEEETLLHSFIIQCLRNDDGKSSYLHFKVADILPITNLIETLIWNLINEEQNQRKINETTMGLLFLQLLNHIDELDYNKDSSGVIFHVLKYIDAHFADGSLTDLADSLFYDFNTLSKQIKKLTGKTYTQLVQEKRLNQACILLNSTHLGVAEISGLVGYENVSYFHRLFYRTYGISPKNFRKGI